MKVVKTMRRYLYLIMLFVVALTLFPCGFSVSFADQLPEPAVIIFSESHVEDEITVTATLQKNPGISDATFQLKFDREALTLTNYEKGVALNTLDFLASNTVETYPFVFLYDSIGAMKIDKTTGELFTLHFKVKDTVKNGEYVVGVESTVDYWGNGFEQDVKVISDTAKFKIENKQVLEAVVAPDVETENEGQANDDTFLAIAISATTVGALLVAYIVVVIVRRKRDKGAKEWIEL